MKRNMVFILIMVLLLFSLSPARVSAYAVDWGQAGAEVLWSLDSSGHLIVYGDGSVEGNGNVSDFANTGPWKQYSDQITSLTVKWGITRIGKGTFANLDNLREVSIAATVKEIDQFAFYNCQSLETVSLSSSLTTIHKNAFKNAGLTHLELPNSLEWIGDNAFSNTNLKEVVIPASVTFMGQSVFSGCEELTTVTFLNKIHNFSGAMFESCTSLTEVDFKGGLTGDIEPRAFYACESLETFEIPDGVGHIGSYAFYACRNLRSILIPDSVANIGESALSNTGITDILIPESIVSIGSHAFSSCDELISITMYASTVAETRFSLGRAENLQYIHIIGDRPAEEKNQLITSGYKDFVIYYDESSSGWEGYLWGEYLIEVWGKEHSVKSGSCGEGVTWFLQDGVLTISGQGAMENYGYRPDTPFFVQAPWMIFKHRIQSVVIEPGVTSLGNHAFEKMDGVESILLPGTVESIGEECMRGCIQLKEIQLPNGLKKIGYCALGDCDQLNRIVVPDSVVEIEAAAFSDCSNLETVALPDSLKVIPYDCFLNCGKLKTVNIPNNAEEIRAGAFVGCYSLAQITIPDSVRKIESMAFRHTGIEEIMFPAGLEAIRADCIRDCEKLKTIHFMGNPPEYTGYDLYGVNATIYYPANNEQWSTFEFPVDDETIVWVPCETMHDLQNMVVESNCVNSGVEYFGCECGYTQGSTEIPALGHAYEDGTCVRCGAEEPAGMLGDANGDEEINYLDAMIALRVAVKLIETTPEQTELLDVDGDRIVSYMDAMLILRKAVKLIDRFPIEQKG